MYCILILLIDSAICQTVGLDCISGHNFVNFAYVPDELLKLVPVNNLQLQHLDNVFCKKETFLKYSFIKSLPIMF